MIDNIASIQACVVGALFAWAGIWKACFPQARLVVRQSALSKIIPRPQVAEPLHVILGMGEIAVAAFLLLPPERVWAMRIASLFAVGFLGYLALAWRIAPEQPCACLGGRATRISKRSMARAVILLTLTLIGWLAHQYWGATLLAAPATALVIGSELVLLWFVSPEFSHIGPRVEKRILRALRLRVNPTCAGIATNWSGVDRHLRGTGMFRELAPILGERADQWRDGCWDFVAYPATYGDRAATAVFAAPVLYDPLQVSVAVVDDSDGTIFLKLASASSVTPSQNPARSADGARR